VLVWLGAFVMFQVADALVHILLLVAVILFIVNLVSGRRTA